MKPRSILPLLLCLLAAFLLAPYLLEQLIILTREPVVMRSPDGWKPATDCDPVDVAPVFDLDAWTDEQIERVLQRRGGEESRE